jgi:hypothetical protein
MMADPDLTMSYLDEAAAELRKAREDNERRFGSLPSLEAAEVPTLEIRAEINARRMEIADGFIRIAAIEAECDGPVPDEEENDG